MIIVPRIRLPFAAVWVWVWHAANSAAKLGWHLSQDWLFVSTTRQACVTLFPIHIHILELSNPSKRLSYTNHCGHPNLSAIQAVIGENSSAFHHLQESVKVLTMKNIIYVTLRAWLLLFCIIPSASASDQVDLGNIRMHMRSTTNSDPENFPIRVLSQTFSVSSVLVRWAYRTCTSHQHHSVSRPSLQECLRRHLRAIQPQNQFSRYWTWWQWRFCCCCRTWRYGILYKRFKCCTRGSNDCFERCLSHVQRPLFGDSRRQHRSLPS